MMQSLSHIFRRTTLSAAGIAALLVIGGGYLRFTHLAEQPYWMDEGFTINAVRSIVERGETTLDSGQSYPCPTYCYPTAAIARALGEHAFSYRLLAALAGTLFIAIIFFGARGLFTPPVALLTSAFTAFSYIQIAWSRQARWYTLFESFFYLALFSFYKALYGDKRRTQVIYGVLCAAATSLAILTHGLGLLLPPLFVGWFCIDSVLGFAQGTRRLPAAALRAAAGLVGAAALFGAGAAARLVPDVRFFWGLPYYGSFYLSAYWLFLAFAAIAAATCKRDTRGVAFVVFAIAVYALPLMFLTDIINYRYLFHLTPALFMLAALGIERVRGLVARRYQKRVFVALVFAAFFSVGGGVYAPQPFYFLEADNPEEHPGRGYYVYTPQPDWNAAYEFIIGHREDGDIVISSMPQFNKIFLREPGYWIKYSYLGYDTPEEAIENDREHYVGAAVIDDLPELSALAERAHGYLVLDYMATDGRLPRATLDYIERNFTRVFSNKVNYYSQVWVYRF